MNRLHPLTNSLHAVGIGVSGLVVSGVMSSFYLKESFESEALAAEPAIEFLMERPAVEAELDRDIQVLTGRIMGLQASAGEACMKLVNYFLEADDIGQVLSGGERCELQDSYINAIRQTLNKYVDSYEELKDLHDLVETDSPNVAAAQAIIDDGQQESIVADFLPFADQPHYTTVKPNAAPEGSYRQTEETGADLVNLGLLQGGALLGFIGSTSLLLYGAGLEVKEWNERRRHRQRLDARMREELQEIEDFANQQ